MKQKLEYIDGLRGVAMLMVLLAHTWSMFKYRIYIPSPAGTIDIAHFQSLGYLGVSLFLCLSGFCLYFPYASNSSKEEPNLFEFYRKRSRRVLPPYYVALFLASAAAYMGYLPQIYPYSLTGADAVKQLFFHMFFIHNTTPETTGALNDTMWSMALEWQLYLFFPLVFVAFRKFNAHAVIFVIFCTNLLTRDILSDNVHLENEIYLYILPFSAFGRIFDFAVGMYAAWLVGDPRRSKPQSIRIVGYCVLACSIAISTAFILQFLHRDAMWTDLIPVLPQLAWSVCFAMIIIFAYQKNALQYLLSSRLIVWLGGFSYSAYLINGAFLMPLCKAFKCSVSHSSAAALAVEFLVIIPIILTISFLFHLVFERPFVRKQSPRTGDCSMILDYKKQGMICKNSTKEAFPT